MAAEKQTFLQLYSQSPSIPLMLRGATLQLYHSFLKGISLHF